MPRRAVQKARRFLNLSSSEHRLMAKDSAAKPVRVGVFSTVAATERAVQGLLAAGFTKEEITVICSDEAKERHFRVFEHQDPAGAHTPAAAATGGAIGAA